MVESHRPLPPWPTYELPPAYSRAPTLAQSLSCPQVQLNASQGLLLDDFEPPILVEPNNPVPEYTAFDETLGSFELLVPLINARNNNGEIRPRYQFSQELTKSGKPWRLKIRRVLPTESRRLSIPNASSSSKARVVEYDDDTTLYIVEDQGALNPFKGPSVEIRGRRAKTLPGIIKMHSAGRQAGSCEFWHMTKSLANDSLKKENEKKMQKYGYQANDEWNKKKKLFSTDSRLGRASKVGWKNKEDKVVAIEDGDAFQVIVGVDQRMKDALVTCFVARRWASGKLSWTNATTVGFENSQLARAVTISN